MSPVGVLGQGPRPGRMFRVWCSRVEHRLRPSGHVSSSLVRRSSSEGRKERVLAGRGGQPHAGCRPRSLFEDGDGGVGSTLLGPEGTDRPRTP
jgi:hypothetical protein